MGDESLVYTLDGALSALRFGELHSCCALSYAGLGWFSEAMEMIILSFVGPAVKSKWGLTAGDCCFFIGMLFVSVNFGEEVAYFVLPFC